MKKLFIMLAAVTVTTMVACKNNKTSNEATRPAPSVQTIVVKEKPASQQVTYTNSSTNEARRKKGMSKAAKGTIIGTVTGAVTGGLITKNAKGAIIGGVIGGGTGYYIGRKKDKKDGRVQ